MCARNFARRLLSSCLEKVAVTFWPLGISMVRGIFCGFMAITYTLKYWTSSDTTRGKTERMHSRFSFDISKINKLNLSINKINV